MTSISDILAEFETAFVRARSAIFETIHTFKMQTEGNQETERSTDIKTSIDDAVAYIYSAVAQKYGMFILAEELHDLSERDSEGIHWTTDDLGEYEYVLILDPVDGTANMLSNLNFGVNLAFGRIRDKDAFTVYDLEAVFVADYLTQRAFRWTEERGLTICPPKYAGVSGSAVEWFSQGWELVFEVPDEGSYLPKDKDAAKKAKKRQEVLKDSFRSVFPNHGCRQIDCTGQRILEVVGKNSIAYGDARGATFVWDVAPSARIVLAATSDLVVADANGSIDFLQKPIIQMREEQRIGINLKWGDTVLVAKKQDFERIRSYLNERLE